jgi:hypothetical protein
MNTYQKQMNITIDPNDPANLDIPTHVIALIAVVSSLTEIVLRIFHTTDKKKYGPLISGIFGVMVYVVYSVIFSIYSCSDILYGVIIGLSASGLYDSIKSALR